jgi:hypothetical protein
MKDGIHPAVKAGGWLALVIAVFSKIGTVIGFVIKGFKKFFGLFTKAAPGIGKFARMFGFLGKMATGAVGAIVTLAPAIVKFGDKQALIDEFATSVGKLTDKFNVLKTNGIGGLDQITKDSLVQMIEYIGDGPIQKILQKMFNDGELTPDTVKDIAEFGKNINKELLEAMETDFGIGEANFTGLTEAQVQDAIKELENAGMTNNEIYRDLVELNKIMNTGLDAQTDALEEQIIAKLAIARAGKESKTNEEELIFLLRQGVDETIRQKEGFEQAIKTSAGLEKFAKDFGMSIEGIPALIDILFPPAKDPVQEALKQLKEDASALKQMVSDVFAPTKAQFELDFAEMDLADAHKEHADLHSELGDLHAEDAELQQDLVDLQAAELLTHEEKLEIAEKSLEIQELQNKHATEAAMTLEETVQQQELINEALEIEDRLRRGLSLSANDQLRREKLRKDLRRVELAAAQGSLEFADLEAEAIKENISALEKNAVTGTDAILKRRKAADIEAKANLRREQEKADILKLQKDITDLNLESVARRNENIIEIEKRRIEIEERLKEIPREIKEAHFGIHNAQKEVLDRTLDIQIGFMEMRTVGEKEMKSLAEAIGLPLSKLDGVMTLLSHLRLESGDAINDLISAAMPPTTPILPGSQGDASRRNYSFLQGGAGNKPFLRHGGGRFKPGQNYIVGEFGPEMLKASPGGGGQITPMTNGSKGETNNIINLNITGLPTDPIAARKIAQNIQRELTKLEREGRSGVVR